MALQYSILSLTFPWLAAFPLGLHQKGSPIFHIGTKTSHLLPWTAPTTALWCSGGFAHWWCPGIIIFTFWHHRYTRKKERWHNYKILTSLTLHELFNTSSPRSITTMVLVELLLNPFTISEGRMPKDWRVRLPTTLTSMGVIGYQQLAAVWQFYLSFAVFGIFPKALGLGFSECLEQDKWDEDTERILRKVERKKVIKNAYFAREKGK